MRDAGEVGLEFHEKIELAFNDNTPAVGEISWMGFSSDNTLLMIDRIGRVAHEFSPKDGHYIRSFGRKGQGPGEYNSAAEMAVDPQRRVYVLDLLGGWIVRYDRFGNYLDRRRSLGTSHIMVGREGEIFVLKSNRMDIKELMRFDPVTWKVIYRIPLSTEKQRFITRRMPQFTQFCYSKQTHRLYYLGPNDYLVKEINGHTGMITWQFGRRPDGFIPLPTRYHGISGGAREEMAKLEMTIVKNMTLIDERYLFVSHIHKTSEMKRGESSKSWVIYDLNASTGIEVYYFNSPAKERLGALSTGIPWNSIAAWEDRLYFWSAPQLEVVSMSNGTLRVLGLLFEHD